MSTFHECDSKLLIVIIEKHKCDAVMAEARKAGATGGTVMLGRGTAENKWLRLLGLDDVEKELLWTILPVPLVEPVMSALRSAPCLAKTRGIMFTLDVHAVLRHPLSAPKPSSPLENTMPANCPEAPAFELLSVIVNSGNADLVMDAARKAGATGGTVINARGTARPEDAPFFGITIVPEKEMVMILSPRGKTDEIMDSIKAEFHDADPGSGIAFRMPVEAFEVLGPKS